MSNIYQVQNGEIKGDARVVAVQSETDIPHILDNYGNFDRDFTLVTFNLFNGELEPMSAERLISFEGFTNKQ